MRVRFLADFDWSPPEKLTVTVAFKKGMFMRVRRVCAMEAIAKGKAIKDESDERWRASREIVV